MYKIVMGRGQAGQWASESDTADHDDLSRVIGTDAFERVIEAGEAEGIYRNGLCVEDGWLLIADVDHESDLDLDDAVIAYCDAGRG